MTKLKVKKEKELQDIYFEKKYLDSLTRLFESNSKNCTAACLIDDVIIIADNNIHSSTRDMGDDKDSEKVKLIRSTMEYFCKLANKQEPINEREIFNNLCRQRIKGEEMGYLKLSDDDINQIIGSVFSNNKDWRKIWHIEGIDQEEVMRKATIKEKARHERLYISTALEIADNIYSDFNRIKKLLTKDTKDIDNVLKNLVGAFKGKKTEQVFIHESGGILKEWKEVAVFQDPKQFGNPDSSKNGYIILKFDDGIVHAETKLLEYLMITGLLDRIEEVYIAISKLCCKGCEKFIEEVSKKCGFTIDIKGSHDRQPEWVQPLILSIEESQKIYGSYYEDNELSFCKECEVDDLIEAGIDIYPYTYINDNIIDYLSENCSSLSKAHGAGELHMVRFSDSDSSNSSSQEPQQSKQETSVTEALNVLLAAVKTNDINDSALTMLKKIIEEAESSVPLPQKRYADDDSNPEPSKEQKQSVNHNYTSDNLTLDETDLSGEDSESI